jgi:hypothetical protein
MKVVAAYLLAVFGGNASPSAEDLKEIIGSGTLFLGLLGIFRLIEDYYCFAYKQFASYSCLGVLLIEMACEVHTMYVFIYVCINVCMYVGLWLCISIL